MCSALGGRGGIACKSIAFKKKKVDEGGGVGAKGSWRVKVFLFVKIKPPLVRPAFRRSYKSQCIDEFDFFEKF